MIRWNCPSRCRLRMLWVACLALVSAFALPATVSRAEDGDEQAITNSIGMKLVRIEPGAFELGSPAGEAGRLENEASHHVEITKPFYLGEHEVTVGQFRAFIADTNYGTDEEMDKQDALGYNQSAGTFDLANYTWRKPGFKQYDDCPVILVSWNDTLKFCQWLSKKEEVEYRLPTEAEWEYACRAGATTQFSCGDDPEGLRDVANVADASFAAKEAGSSFAVTWDDHAAFTGPVGKFQPNAFGLFDMHGNVWEWCADWLADYTPEAAVDPQGPDAGDQKVFRGGSYYAGPTDNRCARRASDGPDNAVIDVGFRVARSAE